MFGVLKLLLNTHLMNQILLDGATQPQRNTGFLTHTSQESYLRVHSLVGLIDGEDDVSDLSDVVCEDYSTQKG